MKYDQETGLYYYRARYYDPTIGRFISEDPLRFVAGVNVYRYVNNRPTQFHDAYGLSERDAQTIVQTINNTINAMTRNGERLKNGTLNNLVSGFNTMTGGLLGKPYRGCGEQTNTVIEGLTPFIPKLDDTWTFELQSAFMFPFYHQWGIATSSNPNDPIIIFDPLHNNVVTVPPNQMPHGDTHPVK